MTPEEFWQVTYLIALHQTNNAETALIRADNALEAYVYRFNGPPLED